MAATMSDNHTSVANGNGDGGSGSLSYALYLHRLELQRPQRRIMRVAATKLQLTDELISLTRRQWEIEAQMEARMEAGSYQERSALNRELQYSNILRRNMQRQLEKQQKKRHENLKALGKQ